MTTALKNLLETSSDLDNAEEAYRKTSEALSKVTKALSRAHDENATAYYSRKHNPGERSFEIEWDKTSEAVSRLSREHNNAVDANEKAFGAVRKMRRETP